MKMKSNACCRPAAVQTLGIVLMLGATVISRGAVIMSYDAGTNGVPASAPDPTSAQGGGWILTSANLGANLISEGLGPDPLHSNLNAWRTLDNLTTAGVARFSKVPTAAQITNAIWCGWKASTYLRLADPVPGNAGEITILFQFGSTTAIWNRRYLVFADIDANGALYANSFAGAVATITTNATDALDYHLYELAYDSATRTVELRVDGQVMHSDWPSLAIPEELDGCLWGIGSTGGRGDGYFNRVTVEVSDPASTAVTLNPTNASKDVAEAHTFQAAFTGCATNLQWYKNNTPIPGANRRSYSINSIVPSDAGDYKLGIADPQTGTEVFTADATLTVNPDFIPPVVTGVSALLSLKHVRVRFSEGIDPATAQNSDNYQFANDVLTVSAATLLDLLTVELRTSEQVANSDYSLTLSGIQDQSGNTMLSVTQAFTTPNLVPVALYDAGKPGNPSAAPDPSLTSAGRWTFVRGTNQLLSSMSASPDPGTGFNAWNITDHTTQGGQTIDYRWSYPKESHEFARTNGWRLRVRARFVDDFNDTATMLMLYGDGSSKRYYVFFDLSGIGGDLTAALGGDITTNLTAGGVGALAYHTHEIVFDPETQLASYYFDGNLISSGWNGVSPLAAYNGPLFGAASGAGQGSMNFNLVEFSVNNAAPPVILTNPVSAQVSVGSSVTFQGVAGGFVGGFQWYKNGAPIPNATGNSHTIASVAESDAGNYTLRAFNSFVEVESAAATLTVGASPTLSIVNVDGNVIVTFTGTLQSATNLTDTFTDVVPQPTSPLILTSTSGRSLFYRSRK